MERLEATGIDAFANALQAASGVCGYFEGFVHRQHRAGRRLGAAGVNSYVQKPSLVLQGWLIYSRDGLMFCKNQVSGYAANRNLVSLSLPRQVEWAVCYTLVSLYDCEMMLQISWLGTGIVKRRRIYGDQGGSPQTGVLLAPLILCMLFSAQVIYENASSLLHSLIRRPPACSIEYRARMCSPVLLRPDPLCDFAADILQKLLKMTLALGTLELASARPPPA